MGYVFASFRRHDTHDMAWRLIEYLRQQGQDTFVDMDLFGAGDFRESIRKAVESAGWSWCWSVRGGSMMNHPTGCALHVSGSGSSLSWPSQREPPFSLFWSMVVLCAKRTVFQRRLGASLFSRQRPSGPMPTSLMMPTKSAQCWINWHRDADLPLVEAVRSSAVSQSCNLMLGGCGGEQHAAAADERRTPTSALEIAVAPLAAERPTVGQTGE